MNCAIGLFECLGICKAGREGIQQCLNYLRETGFAFLAASTVMVHKYRVPTPEYEFRVATDEDIRCILEAQERLLGQGEILGVSVPDDQVLYVEHPLLEPGDYHAGNSSNLYRDWSRGVCKVSCVVQEKYLALRAVHDWGRATVERHARAMLELARRLWKLTQPICATVGLFGSPPGYSQQIRRALARGKPFRWRELEWANILSAELVADVGREFLSGAPWEESEFWEDGAFLGITRSSYQQWLEKGARPLLSYLRRKYPKLRRVKYPT
jgi:hypothetical protein